MVSYQIITTPEHPLGSILYSLGFSVIVTGVLYIQDHKKSDKERNSNEG